MATKFRDEQMLMAFALGELEASCDEKNSRIDLKTVNPEWEGYDITYNNYENSNCTLALYYNGPFGDEKTGFSRLITVYKGWNLKHTIAMLMSAIYMHEQELKEEKVTI